MLNNHQYSALEKQPKYNKIFCVLEWFLLGAWLHQNRKWNHFGSLTINYIGVHIKIDC